MKSQIIKDIETALQHDNFSEALQLGSRLVSSFPNDHEAYLQMGNVFMKMENWSKAIENYEKALAISPNSADAYFRLGEAYELKDDFQAARHQFQTARRLEPSNMLYAGHYGRLLHERGHETNNVNLKQEGIELMEGAVNAGEAEKIIKEQLALAYIERSYSTWHRHPENKDEFLATESEHLNYARRQVEMAKSLLDGSNISINNRIAEIEAHLAEMEQRKFSGYKYLLKAPAIVGVVLLLAGSPVLAVLLLLMAALYYFSQFKPGYLFNRTYFKNDYRDPFIVRRLDAMGEEMGRFTFFGSFSNVIFMKFAFRFVFGAIRYGMVIVMLPYEIIKGFLVNYDLVNKMTARPA
ncbi:MAG: tetratricopeptide repeat protein [Saprospiraceae bacterium]|nr:tetratricopeptide repeat protein [Saprospiraceae bacterium]